MEYTLVTPFDYACKGTTTQSQFIQCNEFKAKYMNKTAPVKQICMRAFSSFSEKAKDVEEKEKTNEKITGEDLISALYVSDEDISVFFTHMRELLTSPDICFVDGEEKLTKPLFDGLGQEDMEGLCGFYVVNFIISSVLKDTQRNN